VSTGSSLHCYGNRALCLPDRNPNGDGHAHPDRHSECHLNGNGYENSDCHAKRHGHAHPDRHSECHLNGNGYENSDCHAKRHAHAGSERRRLRRRFAVRERTLCQWHLRAGPWRTGALQPQ
jgi:hypothetical protein